MNYTFSDLIDFPKVQRLNDLFYRATGIPGGIIDLKGTIITCSGWQDVCTKFHRVNGETLQRCVESDTVFANQIGVGQNYTVYPCGNGLVVAASPILIGGEHVANFISSQFLFHPPDKDFFLEQAKRFGFDETAYLDAVAKVPVIDESNMQSFLEYFAAFAGMLGEMGLKQLRQLEAADALRESEHRWATTLSSIGDAVIATDEGGRVTFMNAVAERLTGWSLAEAAGKRVAEVFKIINEQTRSAVDDPVAKVLDEGVTAGLANHTVLLSRDGREMPIDDSAAPIRDAAGSTIGVVLVFRDITNRKAADEALRESQIRMIRAQEIAHLGSWELDLLNNRLSWSDEVYRIFGLQPQEFGATYEAFLQAVHPEDREAVDAAYSGSLREGRDTYEIQHRVVRRSSGEIRIVHEKCEHFRDKTGRIIKSVGMVLDITERKRAEQELREASAELEKKVAERTAELRRSQGYLAEAQRLSHTGSWVWDVARNIFTYSSEENSRMYGVDKQKDLETEAVLRIVHPDDREMVRASRDRSLREKVDTVDEFRIVLQDGTIKHMHTVRHPVLNDAGDVVQLVGTSVDITERKRAEEELHRLNRELRAVSMCNQVLMRATDEQTLLNDICRIVCDEAGYQMAWVGYAENDEARTIRPVAWAGFDADYVANAKLSWSDETERGRGPGGIAIRTGEPYYFQDIATDPTLAPWRDGALLRGYRSGIAVPLKDENSKAFGAIMIYSDVSDAFTPREISLMEELAGDLAFGINVLRTRAERNRVEREIALLSFALNNVGESAYLIEENARLRFVNRESCRVLGYTREELLGLSVNDIDPDFPPERWVSHWNELKAKGSLSFEGRHRTKDGRIFPVEINTNYFEYEDKTYNLALVRDITERKTAEETRSKLAAIVESSDDAIISKDLEGTITSWNAGAERLYGYSAEEALGRHVSMLMCADQQDELPELLKRIKEGSRVEHYETKRVRKDGQTIDVSLSLSPIRNHAGEIIGASTIARDISAEKHAEEERRQSAERFRAIADYTYDWEYWIGVDGKLLWVNPAVERITGYSVSECMAMADFPVAIIAEADRETVAQQIREAVQGSSRNDFEFRVRHKDGRVVWVAASWQPIYDSQGARLGHRSSIRDIRDRKGAEEALRESEAYLAQAQRLALTGSFAYDPDTREPLYWSEEMFRIFGFDPHGPLPSLQAWNQRVHPQHQDTVRENFENAFREKIDTSDEYAIMLPDGAIKHVHVIRRPVLNDAGDVVKVVGAAMDITDRKRAEEALRESEAYLAEAQRLTHTGSWARDMTGEIVYLSDELYRIFALDPREGLPSRERLARLIHPDDLQRIQASIEKALHEKVEIVDEFRIVLSDGTLKHLEEIRRPVLNEAGDVVQLVGTVVDITDRKETLRFFESMDRINRAMQWTNDLNQMTSDVLDVMLSIFGSDRAFLVYPCDPDAPSFDIAMERTRPEYPVRRGPILTADTAKHFKLYLASAEAVALGPGGDYPLETSRFGEKSKIMIALYPKTGKPWILGTHQCSYPRVWSRSDKRLLEEIARRLSDAVTSLLAHRDLHESEERHRMTLQTAMDGFFRTDMQGRIIEVNEAYCRMSGYSERELLAMYVADISAVRNSELVADEIRRAAEEGPQRFESVHRRKDGSLFDVEISGQYQPIAGGQAVVFVRDITERKQAQKALQDLLAELESRVQERTKALSEANESLQAANKELESFSYSVSHDLRAPLRAIDGFSRMVLKGYADKLDDEGRRKLNVIRSYTQTMGELIDDLLTFSRMGRQEMVHTRLDMEALVRGAWRELTLANPERRLKFSVQRLPPAMGDPTLIKEVVVNLLSNAIKFSTYREDAVVEVGSYPEEGRTVYFIKDNGVGFDMQYYNKLFGVFQRLHSADEFEGTGVGLAIVERIIGRHRGRVWAEGKEGEGATFYFALPRKE